MSTFALSPISLDAFRARIGQPQVAPWRTITQEMIDRFADATDDHQFIHVDPERAAATPFGGTIAHGFLTLSLLSAMTYETLPPLEHQELGVNQGFDRLRFAAPVRCGSRVRAVFVLGSISVRSTGWIQFIYDVTMEIEGMAKPAMKATWLTVSKVDPERSRL